MMNLAEYRRSTMRLADFLPWAALVDEGIVLNKDGSFQRTARFRGPDLDSSVPAELVAVAGRLNNALASPRIRLGGVCGSAEVFSRTPIRRAVVRMWHRPWSMPSAEPNSRKRGLTTSQPISSPSCICRRRRMRRAPSASSMRDGSAGRLPTPTKRCAALSTGPTACCNWSKGSCRSAGGSMTARP